jgi:toxin-antitoxin system PIN domain toxin
MILPDANLFLYAYDEDSSFHTEAVRWCERVLGGTEPVLLLPAVIFGFVRISTHAKVFENPLTVGEAAARVESWLSCHHVKIMDMLAEDVAMALTLLKAAGTAGNLTTDAQIAAMAIRLDAEVHTADLDFGRFPKVRFLNPLRL